MRLEKTGQCSPLDPIIAVTGLAYASSGDKKSLRSDIIMRPTGFEDFNKLVRDDIDRNFRQNFHTSIGNYKYLCQKKENILSEDGKIKEFVVFDNKQPEVFNKLSKTMGYQCLSKCGEPHDLKKGELDFYAGQPQ